MQIIVPEDHGVDLDELIEGREVIGAWRDGGTRNRRVIHLLVPAEETEPIMDRLEQAYANSPDFRVVLIPVEAVLPRLEDEKPEKEDSNDPNGEKKKSLKDPDRVSREELYHDVTESLGVTRVFVAMTLLSSVVAAVGLIRDDVAVIIGAMVIAPLLGPNVAMCLSTTLGDAPLLRRALVTNLAGVGMALGVSLLAGWLLTIDPEVPAIASRTQPGLADLVLALAAGSAGAFAFTRGLAGAVIGVMVAVALMPPLVTFGMLLGAGYFTQAIGALILVSANVVCVNLAGIATFLAQGVRPRTWWENKRAKSASRIAFTAWFVILAAFALVLYFMQATGALNG